MPVQFAVSPKSNQETCFKTWSAKICGVKPGFSTFGSDVASTTSSPIFSLEVAGVSRFERVRGLFSGATVVSSFTSAAAVVSSALSGNAASFSEVSFVVFSFSSFG